MTKAKTKTVYRACGDNRSGHWINCGHWHKTKEAALKCATKNEKKYGKDWYVRLESFPHP